MITQLELDDALDRVATHRRHHTRRLLAELTVVTRLGLGFGALIALMLVLTFFHFAFPHEEHTVELV